MHEIPPLAEQALRAQGFDDAQLEELRRTGRIERSDDAGNTTSVAVEGQVVSIGGLAVGTDIPPEALEKLRRFHRFMPAATIEQLERATGQDIDGDGRIGHGADSTPAPAGSTGAGQAPATVSVTGSDATPNAPVEMLEGTTGARIPTGEHRTSGAMPSVGPFVGGQPDGSGSALIPIAIGVLVIAVVLYLALH